MTVKDRVKAFCKAENSTVSAFEANIGVANGYVNAISKSIGLDKIKIILEKYPNLNIEWLLVGNGNMHKQYSSPTTHTINKEPTISTLPNVGIPYYDVDFIGGFCEIFNNQSTVPVCNVLVPGFEKASLWCNVTGHSMEPKINHGDIIALHECTINDIQYGEIYAVVLDTIRTIKILRRGSQDDKLLYVPINKPDYEEQEFDISRIIKIFEVIGSISKFF